MGRDIKRGHLEGGGGMVSASSVLGRLKSVHGAYMGSPGDPATNPTHSARCVRKAHRYELRWRAPRHWSSCYESAQEYLRFSHWHRPDRFRRGRAIAQRTVRSNRVVLPPPSFDQDPGLGQGGERLPREQFVAQLPVERFHIAVLPGAAWFDEQRLHGECLEPRAHKARRKLGAVVPSEREVKAGQVLL